MSRANPRYHRNNPVLTGRTNDVFRIKLVGVIENQMTVSSFYYRGPSLQNNANGTDLANLASGFSGLGNMVDKFCACCSSDWTTIQLVAECLTTPSLAPVAEAIVQAGTGPAGHEPTEVAFPIIKYTTARGQCGRGRIGMPAVPTAWVTMSKVTTTTAYQQLCAQMAAVINNGGSAFTPIVFSRGTKAFKVAGYADIFFCARAAGDLLGTIRRRKIGRGK